MKNGFNNIAAERQQIIGAMMALEKETSKLAPHPEKKRGLSTIKQDSRALSGDDNDAILGSIMMESFFGAALGEVATAMNAPEWVRNVEWDNIVEVCDEYHTDRANGSYNMGVKGSITGAFNSPQWSAYKNDLSEREKLEGYYTALSNKLDYTDKHLKNAPSFH